MRPRHSPGLQTRIKVHKVIWLVATQECGTVLAAAFVVSPYLQPQYFLVHLLFLYFPRLSCWD